MKKIGMQLTSSDNVQAVIYATGNIAALIAGILIGAIVFGDLPPAYIASLKNLGFRAAPIGLVLAPIAFYLAASFGEGIQAVLRVWAIVFVIVASVAYFLQ